MTGRQELLYLMKGLLEGSYEISVFCEEFYRAFDLELDYSELNEEERNALNGLSEMVGRFSDDENDLKMPRVYFSEAEVVENVKNCYLFMATGMEKRE